jgi:3-methylfumaryl-CoA hydratase
LPKADWSEIWTPDTVQLFRYSALTFNGHRIHYDLPYTREVEGYPALVINGGMTALMLVETARPHLRGAITGYDARAMQPMFIGQSISLNGRMADETAELWAAGPDGGITYRVNVAVKRP